ncbi:plasmid replication initiation protein [Alkalibaculum bacchi]|uniref:Plasmid replication initiation protein n=1 Tax=Alkalibaculum bacchi TaxID=645887 RepID=A0A366HVU3_9FIRM|nr:replication initiation protein [Alkalibaculum bacchi]RBP57162.1 plasmid replication initiation protein [Alkalibaculum bacchi]
MDKNYLVTKANSLITANYDLSLQEQKLILTLASMVQPSDEEFKEYEFKIKDFMALLGVEDKSKYTEIPKITKELMKKVFEIKEGKDIIQLSWLSSARYRTGEGLVVLKFDSSLKPYMLQLKELYTSYKLENILSLKSKYSLRVYELLKCNEFKKKWEVELEEFKRSLGATEKSYSVYQNVKNRIIMQAQKELKEKTDISFKFKEIKTGRKVTSLKFYIESNINKSKSIKEEIALTIEAGEINSVIEEVRNIMNEHEFTDKEIKAILKSANGDIERIRQVYNHFKNRKAANFIGLMVSMVKPEGFAEPQDNNSTEYTDDRGYDYEELEKKIEDKMWQ